MKNPEVSVVIPAYNHEKYVGEAIQSVLDQTFKDLELIIINDGSTDNTEAEILKLKDERIRYFSQENRGLGPTLNRGIELARGEYFNFLPSDDALFPEKLEIQLKIFEEGLRLGLVFAYPQLIDAEGREIKEDPAAYWAIVPYETKEEIFPALFERDFLSAPTALVKMECFEKVGRFDESLKTAQDYDMWMRILKYYDLRLIKRPLLKYRWHGANLTYRATPETELERAKVLLKAYKNLSIEDMFPSLRERKDPSAYAEAYEKLATYIEKSGIPALLPISQIYKNRGKHLTEKKEDLFLFKREDGEEGEEGFHQGGFGGDARKIHLLIETRSLDKGGLEEVIYGIATHLDPSLFLPVVVCIEAGGFTADRIRKAGMPVEVLGEEKEKEYIEILNRYRIDLVNTHYSFFGSGLAYQRGIPVISVLHNLYSWYRGGILDEFRVADLCVSKYIAVSRQVASFFEYRFNIERSRIEIIPDGIDLGRFTKDETQKEVARRDLGFDEGDFVFLHVGAITLAKMQNLLVAVMKEISKNYPKIKLISLGPELHKDYGSFIRMKIEESHLGHNVKLIGFVENPSSYYRVADAFVLPSLIEGWGIATLEAMYHGLPLILTKVGGAEELVENQDIGILIENCCDDLFELSGTDLDYYSRLDFPKNAPDLIEAMLNIYWNREEWKEKAKDGKRKVISHYTWDQVILRYEKEFIDLALERRKRCEIRLSELLRHEQTQLVELEARLEDYLKEREDLKKVIEDQSRIIQNQAEREQFLRVQEGLLKEISQQLQKRGEEINGIRHLIESRYQQLDKRIEYVLMRLSVKERIKERLYKLLKAVHTLVPKKFREKYRAPYRRFFFDKIFPGKGRFEQPFPTPGHPDVLTGEELERFLNSAQESDAEKLFVIYTTDPFVESRGQRSTWLAKEFARRGIPVVFFYWRWNPKEEIVKSPDPQILSVPIDQFSRVEKQLFSFSSDHFKKIFLIEFPDSSLFERINIANIHSFVTVYDCVDDWGEFARAGQAVWYDDAGERYLVRNVDLVLATNSVLAEKLKQIGAEKVSIVPNGVDVESLREKQGIMKSVERGILTIGYFGHLTESWFDWDLVLKTASKKRDWFFHIIGYGEPSGLKFPENVKFWGKVDHQDLPAYTSYWDVAIIPFREGKLTQAVDPIKLYEYLFLGLPVVATNMPHLQGIPGAFPCNRDQFEQTLLLAKETPFNRSEVERFVENSTWRKRVDRLLEEIDQVDLSRDPLKAIG